MFRLILIAITLLVAACATVPLAQQRNFEGNKALNSQNYKRALDKYQKSLTEAKKSGDKQYIAIATYGLARANGYLCNFKEAEILFKKSISLRENLSDDNAATISQNILEFARLYIAQKKWNEAAAQFERAIPMLESLKVEAHDPIGYADVLEDYKNTLGFLGKTKEAGNIDKKIHYLRETYSFRQTFFKIKPYPSNCKL